MMKNDIIEKELPLEETPVQEAESAENQEETVTPEVDEYGQRIPRPYHERAYLLYGDKEPNPKTDYAGTRSFLNGIGFDGGELSKARYSKDYAKINKMAVGTENNGMYCLFCGRPILGVDYYRLPEGNLRCTSCSRTLLNSLEDLEAIYDKVVTDFETFFGVTIDLPVQLGTNSQRKLKKKWKLLTKEEPGNGIFVPCSVYVDKGKEVLICLDNSAPRLSVIVALAHSLTTAWQYINWDDKKKFPKLKGNRYEIMSKGMLAWVEVQYLYMLGERAAAERQEARFREANDARGLGFILYEKEYPIIRDTIFIGESPFVTDGYPI